MIRKFKNEDLDPVMNIWLNANLQAHDFIKKEYWLDNFDMVKNILPKAEIYVYENNNLIEGFIGMEDNYIAGIFVNQTSRSKGIGKALLNKAKQNHSVLKLSVYEKNTKAISFYLRENFIIINKETDTNTEEIECHMKWQA